MNDSTLEQAYQFYGQQLFNNALQAVDGVLSVSPEDAEAHNLRGAVLERLGRSADALAAYEEAVRLKPAYSAALDNARRVQKRVTTIPTFGGGAVAGVARLTTILMGLAWAAGLIVGCGSLFLLVESSQYGLEFSDILGFLVVAILGATVVLLLVAFAQALRLLMRIEAAQRQTDERLAQLLPPTQGQEAPPSE